MAKKDSEQIDIKAEELSSRVLQFNRFLEKYFNWIVAGIAAIIFVSGFFILLIPKYEQTIKYFDVFNNQQTLDVADLQNQIDKTEKLIASYNKISQDDIDKIAAIAPPAENKEEIFSEINYLASSNQLILGSVSLSSSSGYQDQGLLPITGADSAIASGIQTVSINLSLSGVSYEGLKSFLSVLENNLRLMDVVNLNFDPHGETVSLSINAYYSNN
jgi:hypothetical protein